MRKLTQDFKPPACKSNLDFVEISSRSVAQTKLLHHENGREKTLGMIRLESSLNWKGNL